MKIAGLVEGHLRRSDPVSGTCFVPSRSPLPHPLLLRSIRNAMFGMGAHLCLVRSVQPVMRRSLPVVH
jgi:hypothetical protein